MIAPEIATGTASSAGDHVLIHPSSPASSLNAANTTNMIPTAAGLEMSLTPRLVVPPNPI